MGAEMIDRDVQRAFNKSLAYLDRFKTFRKFLCRMIEEKAGEFDELRFAQELTDIRSSCIMGGLSKERYLKEVSELVSQYMETNKNFTKVPNQGQTDLFNK